MNWAVRTNILVDILVYLLTTNFFFAHTDIQKHVIREVGGRASCSSIAQG